MNIKNYIDENKDRFLDELFGLISIPSVSSKSENKDDMYAATGYIRKALLDAGADNAEVLPYSRTPGCLC
jgi:acetylornithine deacetylase/succinyl-diaminopimelate desuccinylase-like protein